MENFRVTHYLDTRSDLDTAFGYTVFLEGKIYILYYNKDKLREVYFPPVNKYYLSCRSDMKTISWYKISSDYTSTKRFAEDGTVDRVYHMVKSENGQIELQWYEKPDGTKVEYYHKLIPDLKLDEAKLYKDLTKFLEKFESLGIRYDKCPFK